MDFMEGNELTFSVVIPTYNRASTIISCVNSVLIQTYPNFEVIIVDDGSVDNTEVLISSINDQRVKYFKQNNGGGSKARNTGISLSSGRYIAFLDSDDFFTSQHLERALEVLKKNKNYCTYTQVVVDRGDGVSFLKPPRAINQGEHISDYLMRGRGFIQTSTLILPAEIAKSISFDESLTFGQDTDFALKIAGVGGELIMLNTPGAIWNDRWSESRLSSKINPMQRIAWLKRIKGLISNKAYHADMGWQVARGLRDNSEPLLAIKYFLYACFKGCYRPKIMIVIAFQIIFPKSLYRFFSDFIARLGVKP